MASILFRLGLNVLTILSQTKNAKLLFPSPFQIVFPRSGTTNYDSRGLCVMIDPLWVIYQFHFGLCKQNLFVNSTKDLLSIYLSPMNPPNQSMLNT